MARAVLDVTELIILLSMKIPLQTGIKRWQQRKCTAFHDTHQDSEETEVEVQECDVVRSKMFNFLSVR